MRNLACRALLYVLALSGCARTPTAPPPNNAQPHYVRQAGFKTVIVFVHGVFGDGETTWKNESTGAYWPDLLEKDDAFKEADIFVHSYFSPFLRHSYTIDQLIENMRAVFDQYSVFQSHAEVVFVCHSMGGIVVRGYLKRYQQMAGKVSLIYFFSTPTDGSHIARMGQLLSKNPQLGGLLPTDGNQYLLGIQNDWRALSVHPFSSCAYETEDTYGFRIVDEASAKVLCDGPLTPFALNHIQIAKPGAQTDLLYSVFRVAYSNRAPPPDEPKTYRHIPVPEGGLRAGQTITVVVPPQASPGATEGAKIVVEPGTTRSEPARNPSSPKKTKPGSSSREGLDPTVRFQSQTGGS